MGKGEDGNEGKGNGSKGKKRHRGGRKNPDKEHCV